MARDHDPAPSGLHDSILNVGGVAMATRLEPHMGIPICITHTVPVLRLVAAVLDLVSHALATCITVPAVIGEINHPYPIIVNSQEAALRGPGVSNRASEKLMV